MVVVVQVESNTTDKYAMDESVYLIGVYQSMKVAKEKTEGYYGDNLHYIPCKLNKDKCKLIDRFAYYE